MIWQNNYSQRNLMHTAIELLDVDFMPEKLMLDIS
jgi:hypothetical protein